MPAAAAAGQNQNNDNDNDNDDALTVVTVATDAPDDIVPPLAIHHQAKQGGKAFGCCCDYRRAVLIFGAVTAIMGMLDVIFRIGNAATSSSSSYQPPFDDDALVDELSALNESYTIPYILLEVMAVVFGCVSIMGAATFSQFGTSAAICYGIGSTVMVIVLDLEARAAANQILTSYQQPPIPTTSAIFYYCFVGISQAIWWYPSVFFLWEVHRGIMTPRTYVREEFSCCCVP